MHLEPLPEAGISSAVWEHQDQGMINYFVQAFGPEPAQVCVLQQWQFPYLIICLLTVLLLPSLSTAKSNRHAVCVCH